MLQSSIMGSSLQFPSAIYVTLTRSQGARPMHRILFTSTGLLRAFCTSRKNEASRNVLWYKLVQVRSRACCSSILRNPDKTDLRNDPFSASNIAWMDAVAMVPKYWRLSGSIPLSVNIVRRGNTFNLKSKRMMSLNQKTHLGQYVCS